MERVRQRALLLGAAALLSACQLLPSSTPGSAIPSATPSSPLNPATGESVAPLAPTDAPAETPIGTIVPR